MGYAYNDYDPRHTNKWIASFVDGHAELSLARAVQGTLFSNPTAMNLLERYNANGTYGWSCSSSTADATMAEQYACIGGNNWRFSGAGNFSAKARFTFSSPMAVGKLGVCWRNTSESPTNFTIRNQTGTLWTSSSAGYYNGTPMYQGITPTLCNFIEIESNPCTTGNGTYELGRLWVYPAAGEPVVVDGTYNIFNEEAGKMTILNNNGDPAWWNLSQIGAGVKPPTAGNVTLKFSRSYLIKSVNIVHYDTSRYLANAQLEISQDGATWSTIYGPANFTTSRANYGMMPINTSGNMNAQYVRLSWSGNSNPVEISQWMIMGL